MTNEHPRTGVPTLVPTKPDAEIAADIKRRLIEAYLPILLLCDEARAAGFEARIASNLGPMGKEQIAIAQIVKVY